MLENKDIILIGNGPSAVENDFSQVINSFKDVLRFNIVGMVNRYGLGSDWANEIKERKEFSGIPLNYTKSKNSGIKITILFINGNYFQYMKSNFKLFLKIPNFRKILIPAYKRGTGAHPIHLIHDYNNERWGKWKRDVVDPSHIVMEHALEDFHWPSKKEWIFEISPSVGMTAILHYIKFYKKVFVIGFDTLLSGKVEDSSHFDGYNISDAWRWHDLKKEHWIINNLIDTGRVQVLED